jgi:hypothetical protein
MAANQHSSAPQHLPAFITAPGDTDAFMVAATILLFVVLLGAGLLFLRLHTLPERMAHKTHKLQFEIVAVLGLLALFTHVHLFWVAGLLLALVDIPDFGGRLERIAGSLESIAGQGSAENSLAAPNALSEENAKGSLVASAIEEHGPRAPKELSHA